MPTNASLPQNASLPERASLNNVTVVLDDRTILRGISLEILPGLTLLRGPNGAGKTTLLRALAGLAPLARGGRSMPGGQPLYIGHRPMLLRGLTARENLAFLAAFRGLVASDVAGALRKWGLGDEMDRPIERLSAGQRRRASLARIETEPVPLVLLDEPFADLDSDALVRLRAAINTALVRGQAVLMATHMHHELDQDATHSYVIDDGALREI
ncbi:MAG TPA: heme ABC exporter ATP-binding protein CcmA [Candidatus Limnocylindria bacterium]|nr:heme ABC exporter ATP-binding protein CcmA [Candidatus Limnocylindria bacterium]